MSGNHDDAEDGLDAETLDALLHGDDIAARGEQARRLQAYLRQASTQAAPDPARAEADRLAARAAFEHARDHVWTTDSATSSDQAAQKPSRLRRWWRGLTGSMVVIGAVGGLAAAAAAVGGLDLTGHHPRHAVHAHHMAPSPTVSGSALDLDLGTGAPATTAPDPTTVLAPGQRRGQELPHPVPGLGRHAARPGRHLGAEHRSGTGAACGYGRTRRHVC
ncbi:hypothetical protein BIV57_05280 [Mangrovactinospora gilvigrisea]|uniref:Uncharacterized protein n=1 Tax=Mangrovactinospora gilvigrisea TaxID=1428644 RepID=A0A1J7CFV9_9ACTN|nr:hypothetical protein [Mangrovactinospora gilvigrisea]OIV38546.1 hypothetical protein BIV57_05280 [Mangrovactinospora gilvigrisea]